MATNKKAAAPAAQEKEVKQDFFSRYSKLIYGCLIGIVVIIVAGFLFFNHRKSQKEKSANQSVVAVAHMEQAMSTGDSTEFRLALEGDGEAPGFLKLLDNYGTRGGNSSHLLDAAICELNLGLYDDAIAHAKKYDSDNAEMASRAQMVIGHAQMQKENWSEAKKAFLSAAGKVDCELAAAALLNAGLAAEKMDQLDEALKCYQKIADKYPAQGLYVEGIYPGEFYEGNMAEAHIARVEALKERASK